uniref:Uncharacterized protein n=1 Tax=Nelumbo nucifera TaxID=4432 RepID=A0A822Z839_NELNU|nr:TPA_asm: hypothetical protein HUJ06_000783 [Nelumbo nucifera]DAD42554.1 TPA_asm: hypothetical protein HUJ06_000784 [Nelumbo nucifera]
MTKTISNEKRKNIFVHSTEKNH